MEYHSEVVCREMIEELWRAFQKGLKVKQLIQKIPEYYTITIEKMTFETAFMGNLPRPLKEIVGIQDPDPVNIPLDQNANFRIQPQTKEDKSVILGQSQQHHLTEGVITRRAKKEFKETATTDRGVFALSQPILSTQQIQLEDQISKIKNQLYRGRKLRKENEQTQRLRLEENNNRKLLQLPGKQFAFDFSGELIKREKPSFKKWLVSPTGGKSMDLTQQMKNKKALNEEEQEQRDVLVSRGNSTSREGKRLLFGNMNKRQISHLPFIKLNDNVKLSENHRSANGPDNSRYTMKSYQSRGESTFRHFSQIQKQKAQRLFSLKYNSSELTELTEDQMQPIQVIFSPKKQSKRMQKYLKKLCEDKNKKFVSEINKSCNFDRLNSPHNYPVHRYYKHDFDSDKRSICESSLASLKLNTSFFKEVKFTE